MNDDDLAKRLRDFDPNWDTWEVVEEAASRIENLAAERERLALAICGGEDAPGYANAQAVETLEHVAKQNQQSHGATINSLLAAEADNAQLRSMLKPLVESCEATRDMGSFNKSRHSHNVTGAQWQAWCRQIKICRAALTGKDTTP